MDKLVTAPAPQIPPVTDDAVLEEDELLEEDLLVEDVSIDGMCGVY
jgi:mycofactocin precursor